MINSFTPFLALTGCRVQPDEITSSDLLPPQSSFSTTQWLGQLRNGFTDQVLVAVKDFTTLEGLATFAATTISSAYLPGKILALAVAGGVLIGGWQLVSGLYHSLTGEEREQAGYSVGSGIFYLLPLIGVGRLWYAAIRLERIEKLVSASNRAGKVLSSREEFEPYINTLKSKLSVVIKGLPSDVQERITQAFNNPQYDPKILLGGTPLDGTIRLSPLVKKAYNKSLQPLLDVIRTLTLLHEAYHMRFNHLRYPQLSKFCEQYKVKHPTFSNLWAIKEGRFNFPWWDAFKFNGFRRLRFEEDRVFKFQHRVTQESLSEVDWGKTYQEALLRSDQNFSDWDLEPIDIMRQHTLVEGQVFSGLISSFLLSQTDYSFRRITIGYIDSLFSAYARVYMFSSRLTELELGIGTYVYTGIRSLRRAFIG